jgi:holo-[acyl-carrier protein] synthase
MIIGIGNDLIDTARIERTLARFGRRFITRVFSPAEIAKAERRRAAGTHIGTYAKRFAAKEACSKALGTGFSHGVYMRDISVENDALGKPVLVLSNGALARAEALLPPGTRLSISLTLTDEKQIAEAIVIIEAWPQASGTR